MVGPRSAAEFIEYDGEKLSLVGSQCGACQEVVLAFPPRCGNCGSEALEPVRLDDRGVVWTYTICHQAGPGSSRPDDVPHVIGLVELAQGLRVVAPLGVPPTALRIGLPVRLEHDHGTTERQIALVAQKNHGNSVDSPICMYRKPFSLSEILASKYVCEPIRLLEICSPCDGAAAVVVTLRDTTTPAASRDVRIAASTHTTALYSADLRSPASAMSARVNNPGPTSTAADQAYQAAGLGPEDIDCVEVQDTDAFCELEAYGISGSAPSATGEQ